MLIVKTKRDFKINYNNPLGLRTRPIPDLADQEQAEAGPQAEGLIDKVKRIVTFFRHSVAASDALKTMTDLKMMQDVETRWNSTLQMCERFVILSPHVGAVLLSHPQAPPMVTAAELRQLRQIIDLLKPIERATVELGAEKVTSLGKVVPMTKIITEVILNWSNYCIMTSRSLVHLLILLFIK